MKMNIGVDAGCVGHGNSSNKLGVYRMFVNLFRCLSLLDRDNHYFLYSFYPISKPLIGLLGSHFKDRLSPTAKGFLEFYTPLWLRKDHISQYWGLSQALPRFLKCRSLLFVHDLAFRYYPQYYSQEMIGRSLRSIKQADRIVTFSQKTKRELLSLGVDDSEIFTIYQGCDHEFFYPRNRRAISKVLEKYQIKGQYLLYVGAIKGIKNIELIVKAFTKIQDEFPQVCLILVGDDSQQRAHAFLENTERVRFLGFIPDADLPAIYSGASLFLHPSLYEGFGHPVVEAMACGAAVIVSAAGSLPEIVGDSGIVIPSDNYTDLAKAIRELLKNTKWRKGLQQKAKKQAQTFSWSQFSSGVLKVALTLQL